MRTTNISPEFLYNNVNGTLSMKEKKSFLGSKLIKFDDNIKIKSENIIYYQNLSNEQLNFDIEKILSPNIYDTIFDKLSNSSIMMDNSQSNEQQNNNTRWILSINLKSLLVNYLFSVLKKYRTFELVKNNMVISNDVNAAIREYITNNLLSRYQFDYIELFISYNDLLNCGLKYNNTWDQKIEMKSNLVNSYEKNINSSNIDIIFSQTKSSSLFSFNYYYNLYFVKI